jgi:hypothetical protein
VPIRDSGASGGIFAQRSTAPVVRSQSVALPLKLQENKRFLEGRTFKYNRPSDWSRLIFIIGRISAIGSRHLVYKQ